MGSPLLDHDWCAWGQPVSFADGAGTASEPTPSLGDLPTLLEVWDDSSGSLG